MGCVAANPTRLVLGCGKKQTTAADPRSGGVSYTFFLSFFSPHFQTFNRGNVKAFGLPWQQADFLNRPSAWKCEDTQSQGTYA